MFRCADAVMNAISHKSLNGRRSALEVDDLCRNPSFLIKSALDRDVDGEGRIPETTRRAEQNPRLGLRT